MELDFEKSTARIDEIIALLESDTISLEESLRLFEEATKILAQCEDKIKSAKQSITKIVDQKSGN